VQVDNFSCPTSGELGGAWAVVIRRGTPAPTTRKLENRRTTPRCRRCTPQQASSGCGRRWKLNAAPRISADPGRFSYLTAERGLRRQSARQAALTMHDWRRAVSTRRVGARPSSMHTTRSFCGVFVRAGNGASPAET
jgi:hypothetical protein